MEERKMDPEQAAKRWGLTPEEQEALKALRMTYQQEIEELEATLQKARTDVRHLLTDVSAATESEVMNAIDAAGSAQTALQKARVRYMLKIREIIGPEKARSMARQLTRQRHGENANRIGPRANRPHDDQAMPELPPPPPPPHELPE